MRREVIRFNPSKPLHLLTCRNRTQIVRKVTDLIPHLFHDATSGENFELKNDFNIPVFL